MIGEVTNSKMRRACPTVTELEKIEMKTGEKEIAGQWLGEHPIS